MKLKKFRIIHLCFLFVLTLASVSLIEIFAASANAANISLTPEMYTDSDYLLNSDGTNSNETIQEFTASIMSLDTKKITDFDKVIPIEYLRTTDEEKSYAYNGKEYGFYVRHRAEKYLNIMTGEQSDPVYVIDVLLVDFNYQTNTNKAEFKIRISPLFSETFFYNASAGEESWTRITGPFNLGSIHGSPDLYQDFRCKMWIMNPRFATFILNENEKNVGDMVYDKTKDNGLIISQSRINYSGSKHIKNLNGAPIAEYVVNKIVGKTFSILGAEPFISFINDVNSLSDTLNEFFVNETQSITCNNENNIIQNETKDVADPAYTRSILASPADEIAFKPGESYAENIIVLSDSNCRTRISQIGLFDIMFSKNENLEGPYLNSLNEEKERVPFVFGNQQVCFDQIEEIPSNNVNIEVQAYFLHNGDQWFSFSPMATGEYEFKSDYETFSIYEEDVKIVSDQKNFKQKLTASKSYKICVKNSFATEFGFFYINFIVPKLSFGNNTLNFNQDNSLFYKTNQVDFYDRVISSDPRVDIRIYDENFNLLQSNKGNIRFYSGGKIKYIEIIRELQSIQTINLIYQSEKDVNFISEGLQIPTQTIINNNCLNLPEPVREGYIFDGWYTNNQYTEGKMTVDNLKGIKKKSITLYAKWLINNDYTYSIIYILPTNTIEGDKVEETKINYINLRTSYTSDETLNLPTIDSKAYILEGWYSDKAMLNIVYNIPKGTIGNKTFYAKLSLKMYTVRFDSQGGNYCPPMQVKYEDTITLPTCVKAGYMGTWNEWDYINGFYRTKFDTTFYVRSDTIFVALWKQIYMMNFMNITCGNRSASLKLDNHYGWVPDYYLVGTGFDLERITAVIKESEMGQADFIFIGWYTNMTFSTQVTKISSTKTGDVTVYAKWAYNALTRDRETEYRITDADQFEQDYYDSFTFDYFSYQDLKNIGIKTMVINLYLRMWEVDDGYQEIFIYGDAGANNLLWSDTAIEHGPGKKLTTPGVYIKKMIEIPLEKLKNMNRIYVRYGAHGAGSDTWKNNYLYMEFACVTDLKDLSKIDYTHNPFI